MIIAMEKTLQFPNRWNLNNPSKCAAVVYYYKCCQLLENWNKKNRVKKTGDKFYELWLIDAITQTMTYARFLFTRTESIRKTF